MADLIHITNPGELHERRWFWCPGCKMPHGVDRTWDYNGNAERPTFSPSVLVEGSSWENLRCHSFVRGGRIEYLTDCTHDFAGGSVDMEPFRWADDE